MNRDQLLEVLEQFGIPVFQFDTPGGGTVVACRRGARVIGLFPRRAADSRNVLWVNPHIENLLGGTARDWEGIGQGGLGGDRLWVSPERNFYYKNPKIFGDWFCPSDMDPGNYAVDESSESSVTGSNRFDIDDTLLQTRFRDVLLKRHIRVMDNPLPGNSRLKDVLGFVGISTEETLEFGPNQPSDPKVCPWGLAQLPPVSADQPGTIVVPTARRANPVGYFGPLDENSMRVYDDHVIFRADAAKIGKLGIRAEDIAPTGPVRVGYVGPIGHGGTNGGVSVGTNEWVAIVRESESVARSSSLAVDPAKSDPDGPRGVIQAYNNGPDAANPDAPFARFCEIEMQYKPVERQSDGGWKSTAESKFMVWHGKKTDIVSLAEEILGVQHMNLFE
jgi:hypothetical protein